MSNLFERFSSRENLKKAYEHVQKELSRSLLSVNPINHPATAAINDLGDQFFVALEKYLRSGKYTPERGFFVYVPKDNLALRPVCMLSMVDRIVYQGLFNPDILGLKIDGKLSELCFANRVSGSPGAFLQSYQRHYDKFIRRQIKAFDDGFTWQLELDVQQYFEHIPIKRLLQKIEGEFGVKDEQILSLLERQLCAWSEYSDLAKGIPQGPESSAVLSNVYLSSMDKFAEETLMGTKLKYFRYNDDIVLMGKDKKAVIQATEKIVYYLREQNLTLNEKTKLHQVEDLTALEAQRIASDYEEMLTVVSEIYRVQKKLPDFIRKIKAGETLGRLETRELRYYLRTSHDRDIQTILNLISILPLKPSLTVHIIQFIGSALEWAGKESPRYRSLIEKQLWRTHRSEETSPWTRFWILKLLISCTKTKNVLEAETEKMLAHDANIIFKIVALYHAAIGGKSTEYGLVVSTIKTCATNVEKSLFTFFLLNSFPTQRDSVVRNSIESAINANSHELNLMAVYLYKNTERVKLHDLDIEGAFAQYLLDLPVYTKSEADKKGIPLPTPDTLYMVRSSNLIPVDSIPALLGTKRYEGKHKIELSLPEKVEWAKVAIKFKNNTEVDILYDKHHLATADFVQLGFYVGKPERFKRDQQWMFLYAISTYALTQPILSTVPNLAKNIATMTKKVVNHNSIHKTKSMCAKKLCALFKTNENPFVEQRGYYQPKFTLLPVPELRQEEVYIPQ